jgi:hypothetical protein
MITKTIKIKDLDYDHDSINDLVDCCGEIEDGDCEPIIVDVTENGAYSLSDGYHRLAGMIKNGETKVSIGILEESDWENHRKEFADEIAELEEEGEFFDEYEHLVNWLSDNL